MEEAISRPILSRPERQVGVRRGAAAQNVSAGERLASAAAGAFLMLWGMRHRLRVLPLTVGGSLLWRGATGRCAVYRQLGVSTAREAATPELDHSGVTTILRPASEVAAYLRDLSVYPAFMRHLREVHVHDEHRATFVTPDLDWEVEITESVPGEKIAWRAAEGQPVQQKGVIFIRDLGEGGCEVRLDLHYRFPGGPTAALKAPLKGIGPVGAREDLRRLKRLLEAGELPTIEGQPAGRRTRAGRLFERMEAQIR